VLAADLAAERRQTAVLRRRIAELQAEVERLHAASPAPRTTRDPNGSRSRRAVEPA
jgi:uncharacterized small protein (DUF1192 family)